MEFDDLPFIVRTLIYWMICGALAWVGWGNPAAYFIIMIIAAVGFFICYKKEIARGYW